MQYCSFVARMKYNSYVARLYWELQAELYIHITIVTVPNLAKYKIHHSIQEIPVRVLLGKRTIIIIL